MKRHDWTEQDDITALYLYKFGSLGRTAGIIDAVSKNRGMSTGQSANADWKLSVYRYRFRTRPLRPAIPIRASALRQPVQSPNCESSPAYELCRITAYERLRRTAYGARSRVAVINQVPVALSVAVGPN